MPSGVGQQAPAKPLSAQIGLAEHSAALVGIESSSQQSTKQQRKRTIRKYYVFSSNKRIGSNNGLLVHVEFFCLQNLKSVVGQQSPSNVSHLGWAAHSGFNAFMGVIQEANTATDSTVSMDLITMVKVFLKEQQSGFQNLVQ